LNTSRLFQRALQFKVAFVPGAVCYGDHPEERHMRLNFSYPEENRLQEAVTRLSECLHSWDG
jgi:2-aminoadipate transaminase